MNGTMMANNEAANHAQTDSRAVLITGASTGIGRACALHLDRLGLTVFAGIRRQRDADSLQQRSSQRLIPVMIDVTDPRSIAASLTVITRARDERGLTGLVNNAGIAVGGPLEFLPVSALRQQLEVNVVGQLAVTQAFLPLLRQGKGRVINMSSISGRVAMPFMGPYAASKFALEALNDSLRLELRPWGIRVISIQPGAIATPIWDKSLSRAEAMLDDFPILADELYGSTLHGLRQEIENTGQRGLPAEEVARIVAHALLSKRPKTRYLVGREARISALLVRFLPDRLRDWLFVRYLSRLQQLI